MYPRLVQVTLIIPWQPPQTVTVAELSCGIYRMSIKDQFDRKINFVGSDIGYGVRFFKSTFDQSWIVVKGEWHEAKYKPAAKDPVDICILDVSTDDL